LQIRHKKTGIPALFAFAVLGASGVGCQVPRLTITDPYVYFFLFIFARCRAKCGQSHPVQETTAHNTPQGISYNFCMA
jgi:hypothetical protein